MNFFVAIPLVFHFNFYVATKNSLSRQNLPQPLVLFVAIEIIFVAIEILLLLVVNSECYVVTGFLCRDRLFFLEMVPC